MEAAEIRKDVKYRKMENRKISKMRKMENREMRNNVQIFPWK